MPSNIALIKYMGKRPGKDPVRDRNLPTNPSLSWTIPYLRTTVELEKTEGSSKENSWQPLEPSDFPIELSPRGQDRYLNFLNLLQDEMKSQQPWRVRSANNFPSDCGIASSASSFAALTHCFFKSLEGTAGANNEPFVKPAAFSLREQARWSSKGSGSSCRSFLPGWVQWDENGISSVETLYDDLLHFVVLVEESGKEVSSSEAHHRVLSSLLFSQRQSRVTQRLEALKTALQKKDGWSDIFEISWAEFWDMHALFETSRPSFGYMSAGSLEVLQWVRKFWKEQGGDGPVVTMDAGPNIHCLWRQDQGEQALSFFNQFLKGRYSCLSNHPEIGFARI